ncbi:hypothetical protein QRT05_01505 [Cellulomonas sp. MW9]|uniref:DUF559 domain-containing protein n=2 Tax=Cellulomonas edaphi TaxID=3053468 RepID=A0ABT7S2Z9_9CELL|nr:hypothetical protein [Cellulomons edaphi]MDM7829996.1 hypothetical protein [Cellulomons edaphi]
MSDHDRPPDDRRRRAAWLGMLAYGPRAIPVGACALALHGVAGLPARIAPEIALPGGSAVRPRDGIRVRHYDDFVTTRLGGRLVAAFDDALVQALPELRRTPAVAVLDNALNRGLVDDERLAVVRAAMRGRRGAAGVDAWWHLVDGRAESPLESDARLRCIDAGIGPHELQVEVSDGAGRFLARGDMGWRLRGGRWLLVEIDGREVHDAPSALYADRTRQNRLLATGRIDLLRFTARDLGSYAAFIAPIRAHLAADAAADRRRA